MKELKIDFDAVALINLEISQCYQKILGLIPPNEQDILKNLGSSSIHMTLFMRDLYELTKVKIIQFDKNLENKFLKRCGCNMVSSDVH